MYACHSPTVSPPLELLPRRPDHRRRVRDARITRVRAFKVDRVALTIRVQRRDLGVKECHVRAQVLSADQPVACEGSGS